MPKKVPAPHLKKHRYRKGQSGFQGRKHKPSLTRALHEALEENPKLLPLLIQGAIRGARKGDSAMLKLLWDRLDGQVGKQALDVPPVIIEVEAERPSSVAPVHAVLEVEAVPMQEPDPFEVDVEGEDA